MRALLLSSELPPGPGGIGTHASQLAAHLCRRGWEITVVAPQDYADPGEVDRFNRSQPYDVRSVAGDGGRLRRSGARLLAFIAALREHRPEVVIATGLASVRLAAMIPHGRPVLAVAHGTEIAGGRAAVLTRMAFSHADVVVCVSEYTRRLLDQLGADPPRVEIITNGADHERYQPADEARVADLRQRHDLGSGPLLLTVGTVSERKGQDIVVRALPKLPDHVRYAVAGRELEPGALERLARREGVEDRVRVLGCVDDADLPALYTASDVLVFTSRRTSSGDVEGFGIAVVEAALCGTPAVVADGSGLVEAVEAGSTGLVVPPEDPEATASAIATLLDNADLRVVMGEKARSRALRSQTWSGVAERYAEVLAAISTENPQPRRSGSPVEPQAGGGALSDSRQSLFDRARHRAEGSLTGARARSVLERLDGAAWNSVMLPDGRSIETRRGIRFDEPDKDDGWQWLLVKRSSVFFDVGANVGHVSLIAALDPTRDVVAVDPNPRALARAAESIVRNGLSDRVRFINAFVSDRDHAEQEFWTVGTGAAGSAFSSHAVTAASKGSSTVVRTRTLDSLARATGLEPDLVKIDVEGAEIDVLRGAFETIDRCAPRLLVEMHSPAERPMVQNAEMVLEWCAKVGYVAYYLKDHIRLDSPKQVAHRGRCHLLLQAEDAPYPAGLDQIPEHGSIYRAAEILRR